MHPTNRSNTHFETVAQQTQLAPLQSRVTALGVCVSLLSQSWENRGGAEQLSPFLAAETRWKMAKKVQYVDGPSRSFF